MSQHMLSHGRPWFPVGLHECRQLLRADRASRTCRVDCDDIQLVAKGREGLRGGKFRLELGMPAKGRCQGYNKERQRYGKCPYTGYPLNIEER